AASRAAYRAVVTAFRWAVERRGAPRAAPRSMDTYFREPSPPAGASEGSSADAGLELDAHTISRCAEAGLRGVSEQCEHLGCGTAARGRRTQGGAQARDDGQPGFRGSGAVSR